MDRRTRARELTMQALYQLDVQGPDVLATLADFFAESERNKGVCRLAMEWTKGAWEHLRQCDQMIVDSADNWGLDRLGPVDRSILRLAAYQLMFCPNIPPKVVLNEAIEIAKKYSSDKSSAFVNGVLDGVLKKLESKGSVQGR